MSKFLRSVETDVTLVIAKLDCDDELLIIVTDFSTVLHVLKIFEECAAIDYSF